MTRCRNWHFVLAAVFSAFLAASLTGCPKTKADAWVSPADDASLAKLESATLERGISRERRARLFFLWGQELAAKSSNVEAIGAFERVVDLDSVLVSESRFNLEILWRLRNEQQQKPPDSPDKSGQDKNGDQQQQQNGDKGQQKSGDQQKNADQQKGQQPKNSGSTAGKSADGKAAEEAKAKDLSSLVRDKEQSSELDKALKAELERRNEKQNAEAGGIIPVEKDW